MSVLLDTNVLSELLRAQPDSKLLSCMASQPADAFFVSAVTQAEMMLGARLLPKGLRRKALEQALEAMFLEDVSAAHCCSTQAARPAMPSSVRRANCGDCCESSLGLGHAQRV